MITSLIYSIGSLFITTITAILGTFSLAIPNYFEDAITQYIQYLGYAQGLVPITATTGYTGFAGDFGLFDLFGYALVFLVFWYGIKILLWIYAMIPWIGKHIPLPHGGESKTTTHGTK